MDKEQHMAMSARWDSIDLARGVAIVAMILYHGTWDLGFLQLIATPWAVEPAGLWVARGIAGSFLALSGFGLALAHAHGFQARAFLRRLAKVAGAALAITLVTRLVFPDRYIFFGILHCIAVCGVLALPFLKSPVALVLAAAAAFVAAPFVLTGPVWDHPLLDWLGLGSSVPATNDYVPICPWFGIVLIGLAVGRLVLRSPATLQLARWHASHRPTRILAWAGRKSLWIYLIHQPILLALLWGLVQLTGPNPAAEAAPFMMQCQASCREANGHAALCRSACTCMVERLKGEGLWRQVLEDTVTPAEQTRIGRFAGQCLAEPQPQAPDAPPVSGEHQPPQ